MADWSGFSDKELKKLRAENEEKPEKNLKISKVGQQQKRIVREKKINQRATTERVLEVQNKDSEKLNTSLELKPTKEVSKTADKNELAKTTDTNELANTAECNSVILEDKITVGSDEKSVERCVELETSSLEKLQLQQQHIEKQNKKKQAMIKETLQQRFKQTQTEAVKLKEIQKQLSHLDEVLQTDVEALRNKIDDTCQLYSQAQRRYQNAETEYVDAKLNYFKMKEQKEQLTEHLYTIIQENELRKAKRLEELMYKLTTGSESVPSSPTSPVMLSGDLSKTTNNNRGANSETHSLATE